jgi:hypothetical protein
LGAGNVGTRWRQPAGCQEAESARQVSRASKYPGMRPQGDTGFERFLFALLALAAVAGIAYGFSCLLDLVQNWAAFSAGIRNLI